MSVVAAALFVLPLIAVYTAEAQYVRDSTAFELEDVFELEYAADPQISPDGDEVVYVRTSMDEMEDRRRQRLWIVNAAGSGHRPLTDPEIDASSPRWSPSGDRIAYVSSQGENGAEIYVRWMETGETARLSQLENTPSGLSWSPSGDRIAFIMQREADEESFAKMPGPPEGAEWAPSPEVVEKTYYRLDGLGDYADGRRQLFVLPAEGGTPRQVTSGTAPHVAHWSRPEWTPDGSALIVSGNRHPDWRSDPRNSDLYAVDLEVDTIRGLTDRGGPEEAPAVSPSGDRVAFTGHEKSEMAHEVARLYVLRRESGEIRTLTREFDRSIQNPSWGPDGEQIYFWYVDEGSGKIGVVDLEGSRAEVTAHAAGLAIGRPYTAGAYSASDEGTLAYTHGTAERPPEVAVVQEGEQSRVLTGLSSDLTEQRKIASVEEITFNSSRDGRELEGWIVKPPGFDPSEEYPFILEIHGGPWASYGPYFAAEIQLYAAAGYVVLYMNPRGSTSYGEEFSQAIQYNYPGPDYYDLMDGVDAVLERGYLDEDRLFVTGGSGGGVLTSWIVGHTDRFRAAVAAKPVINWYSWALMSDMYGWAAQYWHPGSPWDRSEYYLEHSPVSYVDSVSTPTMLITGERDLRTPISETEQFYGALKLRGVETAMVRFPETSHSIAARPSHMAAKAAHVLEWFRRHGGPEPEE